MKRTRADQHLLKTITCRQPQRRIAINGVSQATTTSVWYYRVDVSVYEEGLRPTFISEDESDETCSDDEEGVLPTTNTEHYSILRRYSDFLQLCEKIRAVVIITDGDVSTLPPFPAKENISPVLMGLVRRSSSEIVLEERRVKFEAGLRATPLLGIHVLYWEPPTVTQRLREFERVHIAGLVVVIAANNINNGEPQA